MLEKLEPAQQQVLNYFAEFGYSKEKILKYT